MLGCRWQVDLFNARGSMPQTLAEVMARQKDIQYSSRTRMSTDASAASLNLQQSLADLLARPADPPVIVEGFRLLPRLVGPLLAVPRAAVWLLPTPDFRRAALATRGSLWTIAGRTSDPPQALANLLERDRMFTDRLRADVARLGLSAIEVAQPMTEDDLTDRVAAALGL